MKFYYLSIMLLLGTTVLAQDKHPVLAYGDIGFGAGYPWRVDARLNCTFLKHHQASIGFNQYFYRAKQTPDSYDRNDESPLPFAGPHDKVVGMSISYAYILYPKADFRILLRAGLIAGRYTEPYSFSYTGSSSFVPNYKYLVETQRTVGLLLEPTVEYARRRAFGVNAGPYFIISKHMIGGGLRAGILLGKVREGFGPNRMLRKKHNQE